MRAPFDWSGANAQRWQEGRVDPHALARLLDLPLGESVEWTSFNPTNGDYRVYAMVFTYSEGGSSLVCELHRQGPGFAPRTFSLLRIDFGPIDAQDLATIVHFQSDAGLRVEECFRHLPQLALTVVALRDGVPPEPSWLAPLMSKSAIVLWSKPLNMAGTV